MDAAFEEVKNAIIGIFFANIIIIFCILFYFILFHFINKKLKKENIGRYEQIKKKNESRRYKR